MCAQFVADGFHVVRFDHRDIGTRNKATRSLNKGIIGNAFERAFDDLEPPESDQRRPVLGKQIHQRTDCRGFRIVVNRQIPLRNAREIIGALPVQLFDNIRAHLIG